jgi:formylglycine-generating enzyme required for sulfatase activity
MPRAVDKLIGDYELQWFVLFFERSDRRNRKNALDSQLFESINVRAEVEFAWEKAVSASMTRKKRDSLALERTENECVRRRTKRSFLRDFVNVGDAGHVIQPAPPYDSDFCLRQDDPSLEVANRDYTISATKLPFRTSIEAVTSAKQSDGFTRQLAAFTIALVGGLALAMTPGGGGRPHTPSPESVSSMTHISNSNIACGIDAGEIAKFQKIFSVTVAQLFEDIVPKHTVRVPSFWIDKYLVTNSQFKRFVDGHPDWQAGKVPAELDNGSYLNHWVRGTFRADRENHPVVNVNWYAATAYCQAQGKRLPSEAEWEYAARGGLEAPLFPWGDEPASPRLANYSDSKLHATSPVGSYPPNGYGIYDMAGNVWEFLADEWGKYPLNSADTTANEFSSRPRMPFREVRSRRVIRGGSFEGHPINLWVEYRDSHLPNGSQPFVGFRCAK